MQDRSRSRGAAPATPRNLRLGAPRRRAPRLRIVAPGYELAPVGVAHAAHVCARGALRRACVTFEERRARAFWCPPSHLRQMPAMRAPLSLLMRSNGGGRLMAVRVRVCLRAVCERRPALPSALLPACHARVPAPICSSRVCCTARALHPLLLALLTRRCGCVSGRRLPRL